MIRTALAATCALALTACAATTAPPTTSTMVPDVEPGDTVAHATAWGAHGREVGHAPSLANDTDTSPVVNG